MIRRDEILPLAWVAAFFAIATAAFYFHIGGH